MTVGICYIVGAGEVDGEFPALMEEDMLIACDGGYAYCEEKGIRADMVVGDFDSLSYLPEHPNVVVLMPEKDETDTGWAVKEGWKQGYREFRIYGGTGGRFSHTVANIQLLAWLKAMGGNGILIGKDSWHRVISNEEIIFDEKEKGYLSVFCLGERAEGVYESGLKYKLNDAVLVKENPVGVSNEFMGKESRVAVRKGTLLLIKEAYV
ncbi:MAG: thiamine diphosphokinase [Clostridium sp.]|nr:thiamine diphosphokinase [Clostridium sp.]